MENSPSNKDTQSIDSRSTERRSPRKGPGLGSVYDSPPTRLNQAAQTDDLGTVLQPRRRENVGTQAPDLPTRLEVCVDRNRNRGSHSSALSDSANSINSDKSVISHALSSEPISPLADSVSPRSRSPVRFGRQRRAVCPFDGVVEDSDHSRSPCRTSRRSSNSSHPEDVENQPTKQSIEPRWSPQSFTTFAKHEMRNRTGSERQRVVISPNCEPKLHQWHVLLKLEWFSETSNDLVAEVRLTQRSPSVNDFVRNIFQMSVLGYDE